MKDWLIEQVELIESEFPNMKYETLFDKVWSLIIKNKKYQTLSIEDRFDYLVDNIIFS